MNEFRKEIERVINSHSKENGSNTPDFILADYLTNCLAAFDAAVSSRDKWYGATAKHKPENANAYDGNPDPSDT